jgi:hypothetical protein
MHIPIIFFCYLNKQHSILFIQHLNIFFNKKSGFDYHIKCITCWSHDLIMWHGYINSTYWTLKSHDLIIWLGSKKHTLSSDFTYKDKFV